MRMKTDGAVLAGCLADVVVQAERVRSDGTLVPAGLAEGALLLSRETAGPMTAALNEALVRAFDEALALLGLATDLRGLLTTVAARLTELDARASAAAGDAARTRLEARRLVFQVLQDRLQNA